MRKTKYSQTILVLNLFFLICLLPVSAFSQITKGKKLTPREIAQQTLPSTVWLVMGNNTKGIKSGSEFFVTSDIVATNFHVIKETSEGYAKIYGRNEVYEVLSVIGVDEKNDLALLKIKGSKGRPLRLNTDNSTAIGDVVFAVGNPEGLEGTFSQGIVSSIRKIDKVNLLQITAPISAGSSGGAILNDRGEVVGIAVGVIGSGQSLNFAVPISYLHSLILSQKILVTLKNTNVGTNKIQSKRVPQEETPTEILKKFVRATQRKDIVMLKQILSSTTLQMIKQSAEKENISLDDALRRDNGSLRDLPETRNEIIKGDTATVEVKNSVTADWDKIPFVKEKGKWKIALDKFMQELMKKYNESK